MYTEKNPVVSTETLCPRLTDLSVQLYVSSISMPVYAELPTNQLASIISPIANPIQPLYVQISQTICSRSS